MPLPWQHEQSNGEGMIRIMTSMRGGYHGALRDLR
jgi:hypothetical protein